MNFIWLPLLSLWNRIRGGFLGDKLNNSHTVAEWTQGWLYSLAAGIFDPVLGILAAIGMGIGEMTGWGHPLGQVTKHGFDAYAYPYPGSEPEWWQVKLDISDSPILSLVIRGAIWVLPVVPLGVAPFFSDFGDYRYLLWLPAMAFALPASAICEHYIRRKWPLPRVNIWEWVKPLIFGTIIIVCNPLF